MPGLTRYSRWVLWVLNNCQYLGQRIELAQTEKCISIRGSECGSCPGGLVIIMGSLKISTQHITGIWDPICETLSKIYNLLSLHHRALLELYMILDHRSWLEM